MKDRKCCIGCQRARDLLSLKRAFLQVFLEDGVAPIAAQAAPLKNIPDLSQQIALEKALPGFPEKIVLREPTTDDLDKMITNFIKEKYTPSPAGKVSASAIFRLFRECSEPSDITVTMFGRILARHFNKSKSNGCIFYRGLAPRSEESNSTRSPDPERRCLVDPASIPLEDGPDADPPGPDHPGAGAPITRPRSPWRTSPCS